MHQCSNCSKTATNTCKGCKAMPNATDGQVSSTWYCRAECQKAHWTEHRAQCKAAQVRRALYRAGALAQQIFYLYCKITYMWNPGRIEKIGTTWLIHTRVYTGKSLLIPFPHAIVPDVHDQEALLTYQSCTSAVSAMHNVVKALFRGKSPLRFFRANCPDVIVLTETGLHAEIDEVSHYIKGAKHHFQRVYPNDALPMIDGTDYAHTVIRITMKNGERYALDTAGAQYGWHESVTPWQLYETSRVRAIRDVLPFGTTKIFSRTRADNMGKQHKWIHGIKEDFAEHVDGAVALWQRDDCSSVDLLCLAEDEFQKKQASLLVCVGVFLQQYKDFQEWRGGFNVNQGFKYEGLD